MISLIKSEGHLMAFVSRPVSLVLALLTFAVWALPVVSWTRTRLGPAVAKPSAGTVSEGSDA